MSKLPMEGAEPMLYRCLLPWDTQTTPLGHNALHSVKLHAINGDDQRTKLTFDRWTLNDQTQQFEWGGAYEGTVNSVTAEVKNLVISQVTTPLGHGLVGYDPHSAQGASVAITFADSVAPDTHYEYTVSFVDTLSSELGIVEGTVALPGTVLVTWDGLLPGGFIARWGTYQVRVTIREVPDSGGEAVDQAFSFSTLLRFVDYDVRYDPDTQQLRAKYRIVASETSCADPSDVTLVCVDSGFVKVAERAAPTALSSEHTVPVTDPGEGGRFVLVGVDNERCRRRDHRGKPFPCVNHAKQNKRLLIQDATDSLDAPLLPPETKDMKWNSRSIVWGWTGPTAMSARRTALSIWLDLNTVQNDVHHQMMPNVAYISAHGNDSEFGPSADNPPRIWMYGGAPDPDYLDLDPINSIDRVNLIIMSGCNTAPNAPLYYDDTGLIPAKRKGAACSLAFQKHLKPWTGFPLPVQPTEGPFMRKLLQELSSNRYDPETETWFAPTVSEAYQATKQWWMSVADGGLGQYGNPDGVSTPYYGYDSGFAFNGSTTKLDR